MRDAISALGSGAFHWMKSIMRENANSPSTTSSMLRCFGRLDRKISGEWGPELIRVALFDPDIEIREAAVRAVEDWSDRNLAPDLQRALAQEKLPWMADYIRQVLASFNE